MAVFLAAGDESERGDQQGPFLFGGYVAPVLDWVDHFAPCWESRVLNGKPPLPYFHMTEIASEEGRAKYGLDWREADKRISEAVNVIRSMGSLHLITNEMDGGKFRQVFEGASVIKDGKQPGVYKYEPDYLCFLGFALSALNYVAEFYRDAEKVDFLIERNGKITTRMGEFHSKLAEGLTHVGKPELIPLIGELIPGGKERVPLQAADMALWHMRKLKSQTISREEFRRLENMAHGRLRSLLQIGDDDLERFAERARANSQPSPFTPKPRHGKPSAGASEGVA